MTQPALDSYLGGVEEEFAPTVRTLDQVITHTAPHLDCAVKYRMLMYTVGADWRHWVCAIGVTKRSICLRFLYGASLADPDDLLRAGTSHLKTLDYAPSDGVDAQIVAGFITDAVTHHDGYKAIWADTSTTS